MWRRAIGFARVGRGRRAGGRREGSHLFFRRSKGAPLRARAAPHRPPDQQPPAGAPPPIISPVGNKTVYHPTGYSSRQ
eukprot:413489-Prorocentrum_minimum.AAC.1